MSKGGQNSNSVEESNKDMDMDRFRSERKFLRKRREKKGRDNPKEDRKKKDKRFRDEGEEGRDEIILISRCTTLNIK